MGTIRKRFTTKKQYIALAIVLVVTVIGFIFLLSRNKSKVVFNEVIEFDYMEIIDNQETLKDKLINEEASDYRTIEIINFKETFDTSEAFSVSSDALDKMKDERMSDIAIEAVAKAYRSEHEFAKWAFEFDQWNDYSFTKTASVRMRVNGKEKEFSVKYLVLDSTMPILAGVKDLELAFNTLPDYASLFKAIDSNGVQLKMNVVGQVHFDQPGTYPLTVSAMNKHGNITEQKINITILEDKPLDQQKDTIVFNDPIIINALGPLGIGRIIDLKASGLENETVTIAYKTESKDVTFYMSEDVYTMDDLVYETEAACYDGASRLYYKFIEKHLSYACNPLANGKSALTLIQGSGYPEAFIKDPLRDTIIITIKGVKTEHVIDYHRRYVGPAHELYDYLGIEL